MISLDQVLLLQKKVETAVAKIGSLTENVLQLKSENDALRSKCAELTKAISEKTEQVSSLEKEQVKIEQGIINALNRLNTVENNVINAAGSNSTENEVVSNQEIEVPEIDTTSEISIPVDSKSEEEPIQNNLDQNAQEEIF